MPLRDQPYLPLYVQDFLTDEKLMECSASATGIYIKIMCIMHKSNEYGTILLRQKDKQTDQQILNFAKKIAKYLPYSADEIKVALTELTNEGVLTIESDKLFQKRMVRDNEISIARAEAGSKGGFAKAKKIAKRLPKKIANTEYENEYENESINNIKKVFEIFRDNYPGTKRGLDVEFTNLVKKHKDWKEIIPALYDKLNYQMACRAEKELAGGFVPEWKNLSTWINQRCWEEEIAINNKPNGTNKKISGATNEELTAIVGKHFPVAQ